MKQKIKFTLYTINIIVFWTLLGLLISTSDVTNLLLIALLQCLSIIIMIKTPDEYWNSVHKLMDKIFRKDNNNE